jgi:hypothetical protein
MSKQNLKDVIAEAKTIRETALVQAKLALEEAFTPHLQSILAAKLNELEEDKDEDEALENIAEEAMEETLDLEALLAETEDENLEEAKKDEEGEEEKAGEEAGEEGEEKTDEKTEEEVDITELSPEEVEDYIRKIAAEEFEKLEAGQGEEIPGMGDEMGGEEEIDLDAELGEGEDINLDEMKDEDEDKKMEENIESEISEDDINIDELLAEFGLSEEEEVEEGYGKDEDDSKSKMEEELAQALATIDELRSTLQEVNLLNAKLLYMNKVFKGQNLTESQKFQVVKTFDKAESAKEAKLVYESLISTFTKKEEKAPIKESLGFASKASGIIAGSTNRNQVIDSDAQVDRWAKLAGLK